VLRLIQAGIPGLLTTIPSPFRHLYLSGTSIMSVTAANSPWMNAREAAQYLRVAHRTVLIWAKEGRIPCHRLSGTLHVTYRFLASELDAMLSSPSAAEQENLDAAK
jgi:excisionase family DNA binding protein